MARSQPHPSVTRKNVDLAGIHDCLHFGFIRNLAHLAGESVIEWDMV